jgi:4a-hydroxytetrahydrobiopterin dehydratase
MHELADQPIPETAERLAPAEVAAHLADVPGWAADAHNGQIARTFEFKNFYQTMGFANAVAWVANQADHHPDLHLGYRRCEVVYSTHSVGGLSLNDFICAARINRLAQ